MPDAPDSPTPAKKKMGRPRADVDVEELRRLMELYPSLEETARWFGVSPGTIERIVVREWPGKTFSDLRAENQTRICQKLFRKQVELALAGDKTMLIWLGKQMLGQRDTHGVDVTSGGQPVGKGADGLAAFRKLSAATQARVMAELSHDTLEDQ